MVLTAVCLVAGFALLAVGTGVISSNGAKAKSEAYGDSSLSQVELGRQLFLAKGCITCHSNSKASGSSEYMTDWNGCSGPLEVLRQSRVHYAIRLKDPTQVKSDTMMPNLDLSEPEIEALIAFINSK